MTISLTKCYLTCSIGSLFTVLLFLENFDQVPLKPVVCQMSRIQNLVIFVWVSPLMLSLHVYIIKL